MGTLAPGLALSVAIAAVAQVLGHLFPLVGGAVIAIAIGVLVRHALGLPARCAPGVRLAGKRLLQVAIALLGAGLSLGDVWTTGSSSLVVLLGTIAIGLPAILWLGRLLGVERTLARLIGVGTAICGASAIGALAPIVAADEATIAYAISTVFLYNIAAVILFPIAGHALGLSPHGFGLWAGTAVNDTSSVVATSYSFGAAAGAYAVVVKLTRTLLIVPVSLIVATQVARERRAERSVAGARARVQVPLFILLFLAASALHTAGLLGPFGTRAAPALGQFLIVVALAAVGLSADLRAMVRTGARPLLLGLLGWLLLASLSLLLQRATGLG